MESLRYRDRRPTHPGAILREIVLPELRISQTELAETLGVSRQIVSAMINERRALSPDIAARLARAVGSTAATWLKMQEAVDLWDMEHSDPKKYETIKKLRTLTSRKAG